VTDFGLLLINAVVIIYHTETSRTDSISRSNAEQAIDKEEPIAEAPQQVSLGEAEGHDRAERNENEGREQEARRGR
jgi:hypothetical protein